MLTNVDWTTAPKCGHYYQIDLGCGAEIVKVISTVLFCRYGNEMHFEVDGERKFLGPIKMPLVPSTESASETSSAKSPPYRRERRGLRFVEPTEIPDGEAE